MREPAHYYPQSMEEFIGNPLLETIPPMDDPLLNPQLLLVRPPYKPGDRHLSASDRLTRLQRLAELHIPTKEDVMLLLSISRSLRWGYAGRNPMGMDTVRDALQEHGIEMTEKLRKYLTSIIAPIYGFPVLGISGVGKTTSVQNALSLFPQAVCHKSYRGIPFEKDQLVWLKVDCPGDGTPKGLCSAILRGIDEAMGTDYAQQIIRNRMSKDVLLVKVSQLVQSLYLGILVIDDIQNLCSTKRPVSDELLSFMVSMANNLKIPVVMVGSPKILDLLQKEFQQAKRASGEGEIRMNLMPQDSPEWNRFMKILWGYQYTARRVNFTEKMEKAFFEESVGNPFVAATLYKLVQDDAIISRNETFTAADVRRVAGDKMGITAKMRRDMLNGVDVELNRYRHLWSAGVIVETDQTKPDNHVDKAGSQYSKKMLELATKLEAGGIDTASSRSYARQAIAAYPNEGDIEVLFGYAMELQKTLPDSK